MKMWLKSFLVFLAVGVAAKVVSKEIYLDARQKKEEVVAGSRLTLHCNVTPETSETSERVRVSWHFNDSGPSFSVSQNMCEVMSKTQNTNNVTEELKSNSNMECRSKTLTLTEVNETNSGWYFCKITTEIPTLLSKNSSGTKLVVRPQSFVESTARPSLVPNTKARPGHGDNDLWMWILMGVSSFILIVVLVVCAVFHRGKCNRSTEEDPIYANTRPAAHGESSPRTGVSLNTLKAVPSFRNARAPSPAGRYEEGKPRSRV